MMSSPTLHCLTSTQKSSFANLLKRGLLTIRIFPLPVTDPLLLLLPKKENTAFVTVPQKASMTAAVNAIFPSRTVISVGIPLEDVFIMDMIFTCWLLLIQKVPFLFFHCFILLPCMTHMDSSMPFSVCRVFFLISMWKNFFLILLMMHYLITSIASGMGSHLLLI